MRPEDLDRYDSPLMGFDGRMVVPRGMIRLLVQVGDVEIRVNFIVVEAFSPYTAILARPWLHAMGVVPSTLLRGEWESWWVIRSWLGSA